MTTNSGQLRMSYERQPVSKELWKLKNLRINIWEWSASKRENRQNICSGKNEIIHVDDIINVLKHFKFNLVKSLR